MSPFVKELRLITGDLDNFECPFCFSTDRERHLFMYFDRLHLWDTMQGAAIMHFAPELNLKRKLDEIAGTYIKFDICPNTDDVARGDITCIDAPDDHYDIVICNHVLEHVPDDGKAISEVFRVLKPGGYAIMQTPFTRVLADSFCDRLINTDELRLRYYGQEDHVRIYGTDLFEKFESAGFQLQIRKHSDFFSARETSCYGVSAEEDLVILSK